MSVDGELRDAFSSSTITVSRQKENIQRNYRSIARNGAKPRAEVEADLAKWDEGASEEDQELAQTIEQNLRNQ